MRDENKILAIIQLQGLILDQELTTIEQARGLIHNIIIGDEDLDQLDEINKHKQEGVIKIKTKIYKNYKEFSKREDKNENGVSEEFAANNVNFEEDNETNKGCWNCTDCTDCILCTGCTYCKYCTGCTYCTDCTDCIGCINCYDCTRCADCTDCKFEKYAIDKVEE